MDDAATEGLMSAFYQNWPGGMGKAEVAQAELRANPKWAGPYYYIVIEDHQDGVISMMTP